MTTVEVKPSDIRVGDRIATKAGTWFTVGEIKDTLMAKPGWPEDPTINPSHAVVYTFTSADNSVAPYSFTDEELVRREAPGE